MMQLYATLTQKNGGISTISKFIIHKLHKINCKYLLWPTVRVCFIVTY